MAQPVFDDHPLEEYFRQAGEIAEDMPGTHIDLSVEQSGDSGGATHDRPEFVPAVFKLPHSLSKGVQALTTCLSSSSSDNQFAERFKYDVISSSLLSITLSATPRRGTLPSRLPDEISDHSRTSSTVDHPEQQSNGGRFESMQWPTALASIAIVALATEYYFVALLFIISALVIGQMAKSQSSRANVMNSTMTALNELISSGNVWDSVVNEAMMLVEKEERRPNSFYGPTSPQSPFSPLRLALQSSLHTTQNQCDNVRQLLSALTSPAQASQLSEMYAPSSPNATSFLHLDPSHPRPLSDPVAQWRKRTTSLPHESAYNKRATWNGSYAALAQASKSPLSVQRTDKRRSDLSMLFTTSVPAKFASMSAPTSPMPLGKLADVQEEADLSDEEDPPAPRVPELSTEYFGMAALDLRRKRRSAGMDTIRISRPPSYSSQAGSPMQPSISFPGTTLSASRFTLPQTSRNPLSLSALRLALHGALSAKRYACSHLLALRFDEDEDYMYWEDVRSMMALLTSTFADASARLTEALDESEKKRMKDERSSSPVPGAKAVRPSKSMQEMVGFAPMPSHLTRFAAHVDTISTALDDARTHLEQCVASLRDPLKQPVSSDPFLDDTVPLPIAPNESPVLQAYDRLRKELGYALRECERGREHLLNTIAPPACGAPLSDGEDEMDAVPPLVPDTATSDEGASATSSHPPPPTILPDPGNGLGLEVVPDDATEHLLMGTSSQHLPPLGVDQVYEAESGAVALFSRERSKLSREERIQMAKEKRRESGGRGHLAFSGDKADEVVGAKWGPEGEVVQELKDVIWKVSEKKRRMSEQVQMGSGAVEESASLISESVVVGPVPDVMDDSRTPQVDEEEAVVDTDSQGSTPTPPRVVVSDSLDTSRTFRLDSPPFNLNPLVAASQESLPIPMKGCGEITS